MFKLNFDFPALDRQIDLQDEILLLGSCFSNAIGSYLTDYKFKTLVNPLGTLFNPISIFNGLNLGLNDSSLRPFARRNDLFFSWDVHSEWSGTEQERVQRELQLQLQQMQRWIHKSKWIIITLGTAHVYELNETGEIVANCHKFPRQNFSKRLLAVEEIIEAFEYTRDLVQKHNPEANWLFTVSPVRHVKDGLVQNNHSKAILIQSVARIVTEHQNCHYFPAYEIVVDELRDYRFYKEDLIHPNDQAVNYVWHAFQRFGFNQRTISFCKQWLKLLSAIRHRPLHMESRDHQVFLQATRSKLKELENMVDITAELEIIDAQIQE